MIVLHGIQLGILLAFLVGPGFFTILQTSIEKGFLKGALVAVGVSISDTLDVVVCYFGLVRLVETPAFRIYLGYVGGSVLVLFGLYHLVVKSRRNSREIYQPAAERKPYRYVLKGFIMNGLSPSVLIFWVGTLSVASLDLGYSTGFEFFLFFAAVLVTVLATDILKAYLAGKLSTLVTPRLLMIMNGILGVGMIVYGSRLIYLAVLG